ncbi:MAG: hypothetical protein CMJ78_02615 [Planctomycetaceae bacterium]|nr:hypothetical protein [Planctomycetaceae bacterium]
MVPMASPHKTIRPKLACFLTKPNGPLVGSDTDSWQRGHLSVRPINCDGAFKRDSQTDHSNSIGITCLAIAG